MTEANPARRQWICSTLDVEGGKHVSPQKPQYLSRGVGAKDKLWRQGTALKIRFLQGPVALHERTLAAARAWLVDGVRLGMQLAQADEPADIRIAFNPGGGSWSYVGTDSRTIHPSQPTMNLGWATLETPEQDFCSVVIHEFGHALGLLHEHNHPDARIDWDKSAVYADLGGAPNHWDKATIDSNVFAKFDEGKVVRTEFDDVSVMIYTIPSNWTTNRQSFMPSWKLSKGDANTILKLYS